MSKTSTTPSPGPPAPRNLPAEPSALATRQARLGLVLFFLYTAVYAGFMGIAAFAPQVMAWPVWRGVNLAVLYGLGLIVGAVVLALSYMAICGRMARRSAGGPDAD